jgi:hypothetical protein
VNETSHRGAAVLNGVSKPALIFPLTMGRTRRARLGQAVWTVVFAVIVMALIAAFIGTFRRADAVAVVVRVIYALAATFFFLLFLGQVFGMRSPGNVALLAEGIYWRGVVGSLFLPWDSVAATGPHSFAGCLYLGIRVKQPAEVQPKWLGFFRPLNRKLAGWDHTFPLSFMNGSEEFRQLVEGRVADPKVGARVLTEALAR